MKGSESGSPYVNRLADRSWRLRGPLTYLYVRTPIGLLIADKVLGRLDEITGTEGAEILALAEDNQSWEDGLVLRFRSLRTVQEMQSLGREALAEMAHWAIWRPPSDVAESVPDGPFFKFAEQRERVLQICLRGDPDSRRHQQDVIEVERQFRDSKRTLWFRDGLVIAVHSKEAATLAHSRIARQLRRFDGWAIIDSAGDAIARDGHLTEVWIETPLAGLSWVADEDPIDGTG